MSKQSISIISAGASARELSILIERNDMFVVENFVDLDSNEHPFVTVNHKQYPIVGQTAFLAQCKKAFDEHKPKNIVFAFGDPTILIKVLPKFKDICLFPNIVDKISTTILGDIEMGIGNVISFHNFISFDVQIGSFNYINIGNLIGHEVRMGDCNIVNPSSNISGNVQLGSENLIGSKSFIMQGVSIGHQNIIGSGSVLRTNVLSGYTYSCRPAVAIAQKE